jgi:hypothetical protein
MHGSSTAAEYFGIVHGLDSNLGHHTTAKYFGIVHAWLGFEPWTSRVLLVLECYFIMMHGSSTRVRECNVIGIVSFSSWLHNARCKVREWCWDSPLLCDVIGAVTEFMVGCCTRGVRSGFTPAAGPDVWHTCESEPQPTPEPTNVRVLLGLTSAIPAAEYFGIV